MGTNKETQLSSYFADFETIASKTFVIDLTQANMRKLSESRQS